MLADPRSAGSVLLLAAALILGPSIAFADDITCTAGASACDGSANPDTITGSTGADTTYAGDGNDTVNSGDGNDLIWGGAGSDTVNAGAGDDSVTGDSDATNQSGSATMTGEHDVIDGGSGSNVIVGDGTAQAYPGDAKVVGAQDTITTGSGGDGTGYTSIVGDGNAVTRSAYSMAEVFGATDTITVTGPDGVSITGDGYAEVQGICESACGGTGTLTGAADTIDASGATGGVSVVGDGAATTTVIGAGDTITTGSGDDYILGDGWADMVDATNGNDVIHAGAGDDEIYGDGTDGTQLIGGADTIYGDDGNDFIVGDGYNYNELIGGNDVLYGGNGDDEIYGDYGINQQNLALYDSYALYSGTAVSDVTAAVLGVTGGDDQLYGGAGNDILYGQEGNDYLCGDDTTLNTGDQLFGGDGIDLACAHDDATSATSGIASVFNVATNDEQLLDESSEGSALMYSLLPILDPGITATIDNNGNISYTATQSGKVRYAVTRKGSPFTTFADLLITVAMAAGPPVTTPPPTTTPPPPTHHHPHDHHASDNNGGGGNDHNDTNDDVNLLTSSAEEPLVLDPLAENPTDQGPVSALPVLHPHPTTTSPGSGQSHGHEPPLVALMLVGAVIGALGRGGLSRQAAFIADRDDDRGAHDVTQTDAEGWGDRSFTWRFPGHGLIDAASAVIPVRLARFSPLLGRLTDDGSELRAMLGSLWLAAPVAGAALGVAAVGATHGTAVPPPLWMLIAGAVLGTLDAFAGLLAVGIYTVAALASGAITDTAKPDPVHSVLVILGLSFLWMAIPLIGSAIRPFRRLGDRSVRHVWDRAGDIVIAALLCGWVAQKLIGAMDLFAGQPTGLPQHANLMALIIMGAVTLRIATEHFALVAYPKRLNVVEAADEFPQPFLWSTVAGALARSAVFGFIGYAFIGWCWQLWLGTAVFLIPQLIEHLRDRFRTIPAVHRILPRGIVEIFVLIVACTIVARYAMSHSANPMSGIQMAFLLIALPPAILGALSLFTEDRTGKPNWMGELAGAAVLAATAALAFHGWDY